MFLTLIVSSVSSICFLQNSFFSDSSFCWALSSANILSMASFTLVNGSRDICTARVAKDQSLWRRAACKTLFMALSTALVCASARLVALERCSAPMVSWLDCRKLSVFVTVLPNKSRASSDVRMEIASLRATSSSDRTLDLPSYASCSSLQFFSKVRSTCSSAVSAAFVASISFLSCAACATVVAKSSSFCFCWAVAAAISRNFAPFNFLKELKANASAF
mmetsp:Transcript_19651/g.45667  ORF Transcript_19651/g.45667 Transcript_19651/m.45667 type:complete len:220 (-) Transcript_19651:900-1559(-)